MAVPQLSLTILLLVSPALGYFTFKNRIPNADIVPHPCKPNYMWAGVGHENPDGGGVRNIFGQDFDREGRQWTNTLCLMDSDGDGMTNGQELGDPNCVWTEGAVPEVIVGISHPGVCNPYGQGVCAGRDDFVDCELETFGESCDVIKRPEVKTLDLRFLEHSVPATETNYYCQYFDLPNDQDYHMVANEGLIDNHNVLHHMLLYGCPDSYQGSPTDSSPNLCSMSGGEESCNEIISLWAVGVSGTCFGDDIGFRFGATGFKKVKLEIHYNNPMGVADYTDKTGIRLFYRPELPGVQDLVTFSVGQNRLTIPPGKQEVTFKGTCPGQCSNAIINQPIKVVSTLNHMHYMGRAQRTEVIRDGQLLKVLADDPQYRYDNPADHKLDEPFEVLPGDTIQTTCTYSSMSKNHYVFFGDGTNDEMCFAFLTVYPAQAFTSTTWCVSYGPLSTCEMYSRAPKYGCDWGRFTNLSDPEMTQHYLNLAKNCNLNGLCRPECKEVADEIMSHACMGDEMRMLVGEFLGSYPEGREFLARLYSCGAHLDHQDGPQDKQCSKSDCDDHCSSNSNGDGDYQGPYGNAATTTAASTPHLVAMLVSTIMVITMATFGF